MKPVANDTRCDIVSISPKFADLNYTIELDNVGLREGDLKARGIYVGSTATLRHSILALIEGAANQIVTAPVL